MSDKKTTVNPDHTVTRTETQKDGSGHSETTKAGILTNTVVSEESWGKGDKPDTTNSTDKSGTNRKK